MKQQKWGIIGSGIMGMTLAPLPHVCNVGILVNRF
jgi:hypothetical protein